MAVSKLPVIRPSRPMSSLDDQAPRLIPPRSVKVRMGGKDVRFPISAVNYWHAPLLNLNRMSVQLLCRAGIPGDAAKRLAAAMPFVGMDEAVAAAAHPVAAQRLRERFVVSPRLSELSYRYSAEVAAHTHRGPPPPDVPSLGEEVLSLQPVRPGVARFDGVGERGLWLLNQGGREARYASCVVLRGQTPQKVRLITPASVGRTVDELAALLHRSGAPYGRVGSRFVIGSDDELRAAVVAALLHAESLPRPQRQLVHGYLDRVAKHDTPISRMTGESGDGMTSGMTGIQLGKNATFDTLVHESTHDVNHDLLTSGANLHLPPAMRGPDFARLVNEYVARTVGQRADQGWMEAPEDLAKRTLEFYGGGMAPDVQEAFCEVVRVATRNGRSLLEELRVRLSEGKRQRDVFE